MTFWHTLSQAEIEKQLRTDSHFGLTNEEVVIRQGEFGLNKLKEKKRENFFSIFARQFESPLIFILLAAGVIVYFLGQKTDSFVIVFILIFNAVIGVFQEGRAQNMLLALKNFVETKAVVLREEKEKIISDEELVPGDVIILREGEKVPADCRVVFSGNLTVDEASITGESSASSKISEVLEDENLEIAEMKNMVFKGTFVASGGGKAIVVNTGINTFIGKISQEMSLIDTEIPLKADMRFFSKIIMIVVVVISALIFLGGFLMGNSMREMFSIAVAFAVSIIPESLPIILTLVLASGVWRMAKRNALVKRLQAVEALGQAKIIAVDKTGTITKNELVIQKMFVGGKFFEASGVGYETSGDFFLLNGRNKKIISPSDFPGLVLLGKTSAFCGNAKITYLDESQEWSIAGDSTEAALIVLGRKLGFKKSNMEESNPLIWEIPFNYKTHYHTTLHKVEEKGFLTIIGSPEGVIDRCKKIWSENTEELLSEERKKEIEEIFQKMSADGLRVLAVAIKQNIKLDERAEFGWLETENLTLVGFCGMKDALRLGVREAIEEAKEAGIKTVMITGDHKLVAHSIAKEAGIWSEGDEILTGKQIEEMNLEKLTACLSAVSVFARVGPEHKLKIIQAYKKAGKIIAMTGDGVNDALPLVAADLGIAMGRAGTEVAKEAADIILLDDNFSTISAAIEEGRAIFKTLQKVILYLFSTATGEAITVFGAMLLGFPLPLLASQILWLNLVTDSFFDVALSMEPKDKNLLRRSFSRPGKWLLDKKSLFRILILALPMATGSLFLFARYLPDVVKAGSVVMTTMAVFHWFNVWNCRSENESVFKKNFFSNKFLFIASAIVIPLQLAALYLPFLRNILHTVPLVGRDWLLIIIVASSIIAVEEIRKLVYRKVDRIEV